MELTHNTPPADSNIPCPATGELVIQNGRLSGARRPLHPALTLIGRSADCDMRLNVDGVSPLHCALVQGLAGLLLRDLQSEGGTLVNGEPTVTTLVHDGDLLTVGPFRFRVCLPRGGVGTAPDKSPVGSAALHDLEIVLREKEALRIQAAAVAAQQAALTEEEAKLQQQQTALRRQEEQLAAHLEEKRKRFLDLQQQVQTAREELRTERAAHEARSNDMLRDLTRVRGELALSQKRADTERRRLVELRRRLKKRWRRHWSMQESTLQRREGELAKQRYALEKDNERLQKERAALVEARLRFNGEVELGKRQLQAAWDDLRQGQRRWKDQRNLEQAELRRQAEDLCLREETLRDAEEELSEQRQHWEVLRLDLEREVEGLEGRVRNYRRKLLDQESGVRTNQTTAALAVVSSSRPPVPHSLPVVGLATLHKVAAELADQRLHLAEQCERLLRAQQRWQENRDAVVAELEVVGMRLHEREQTLAARECLLQAAEYEGRQRREQQALARQHLDGWQARLAAREAAWESEREGLLARLHAREELVKRYLSIMADLRRRWAQRRRQEVEHWRAESKHCQEIRQHCALLWEEYTRRNAAVEQEQHILAERALAMEQFRLECIGQSANSPAAEKRLERLRRRWAALSAAARRTLAKERHALQVEASRLEERSRQLEQYAAELAARAADLSSRQTEWQHEQTSAEGAQTRMRQELQSLRVQHDLHARQIHTLRDELERMAQTLIEESEPLTLPAVQAA